jgi:hypothetical protein
MDARPAGTHESAATVHGREITDEAENDEPRPYSVDMADSAAPHWRVVVADTCARVAELLLALIGLAYVFGSDQRNYRAALLGIFDAVALGYLLIGFWVVRRGLDRAPASVRPSAGWLRGLRRKLSFLLTVVASLTGLGAASDVLVHGVSAENDAAIKVAGVLAVFCAWTLLHVGYAGFYHGSDESSDGPGLRFPDNTRPATADYLYFAITLGVSFAVSDVEVIRRRTRWHVLVHEIISFFYNAAVLAIAISVVTGK